MANCSTPVFVVLNEASKQAGIPNSMVKTEMNNGCYLGT